MTELTVEQKFQEMLILVKEAKIDFTPNNTQKLKLYAFYKQATEGDISTPTPGVFNMVERAKWNAWNAIKGLDKTQAMEGYLKIFTEHNSN